MNNIDPKRVEIQKFREEVEKKLPLWLRTNPRELRDTLDELEAHIWDKASEIAKGEELELIHIQQAIAHMGAPSQIAKEYRMRGTPKYFITEELWPYYLKAVVVYSSFIVLINLLTMAFAIGKVNIDEVIVKTFSGIFEGFLIGFVVLSLIFIQLSWHGFLPQDLGMIFKEKGKAVPKETEAELEVKYRGKIDETRIRNYGINFLGEGIAGIVFGFLLIFLPFNNIIDFFSLELCTWLRLWGGIVLLVGITRFTQVFIGNNLRLQQTFKVLYLIPMSLKIPLMWQLRSDVNPNIIYNMLIGFFSNSNIALYTEIAVWLVIVGTIIRMIVEAAQIIVLEIQGFPKKKLK
ncbi:MAG: hypothetical protein ACTSQE_03860 [Candidatus Heimdallarchaeaceae archaeon]